MCSVKREGHTFHGGRSHPFCDRPDRPYQQQRGDAAPIHPKRFLCANRNEVPVPPENVTRLNFCDRYYYSLDSNRDYISCYEASVSRSRITKLELGNEPQNLYRRLLFNVRLPWLLKDSLEFLVKLSKEVLLKTLTK